MSFHEDQINEGLRCL